MVKLWLTFFTILGFITCCAQEYKLDNWQVEDGLPQNTVNNLIQTSDRYLWLATGGGLVRFDGQKFVVYDMSNTPALKSNRIFSLFEDSRKKLWIGTVYGGVVCYDNGVFKNLSDSLGLAEQFIVVISEDTKGNLYIGTVDRGVTVLPVTGKPYKINQKDGLSTNIIISFFSDNNALWILNEGGANIYRNGRVEKPSKGVEAAIAAQKNIRSIEKAGKRKEYWIAGDSNILVYRNGLFTRFPAPEMKNICLKSINDSTLYAFGLNGALKINPNTLAFENLIHTNKFPDNHIRSLCVDNEGNLWMGTDVGGLYRLKKNPFSIVDESFNLPSRNYYGVIANEGAYWIATSLNGLYHLQGSKQTIYTKGNNGLVTNNLTGIFMDKTGRLWIGTNDKGIQYREKGVFYFLPYPDGLYRYSTGFYQDPQGKIYAGTNKGLYYVENSKLVPVKTEGRGEIFITYIFRDKAGKILVSSHSGLYVLDGQVLKQVLKEHKELNYLRGIHQLKNGDYLIGSYGNGLYNISNNKVTVINTASGLKENVVSYILEDNRGNIWMTGNKGITRIPLTEILEYAAHKTTFINSYHYNKDNGLASAEFNGGFINSGFRIKDNCYVFSSANGAVKIDFDKVPINTVPPGIKIEKLFVNNREQPVSPLKIKYHDNNRIEIEYSILNFTSGNNINSKYILEGYDEDWVNNKSAKKAIYTGLLPGKYTFKVIGSNNDGVWNFTGQQIEIVIVPLYYMTWWFRLLVAAVSLLVIIVIVYFIIRTVKKRAATRMGFASLMPDLVLRMSKQGRYIDFIGNKEELQTPFENLKGRYFQDVLPPDLTKIINKHHEKALRTHELQVFDYEIPRADGATTIYEGRMVAINDNEVMYIIRNVTEARKAENLLRESQEEVKRQQEERLHAIIETEENERGRIANDLHDGIAQMISLVKLSVSALEIDKEKPGKESAVLGIQKLLDSITADLKNVSYNLMPSSLSKFGLIPALEEMAEKMQVNSGISFRFVKHTDKQSFDNKTDLHIYRIAQELLNNSLKHAKATEITLQLIEHEDGIVITFENNGLPFDPVKGQNKTQSRGLKNIVSRVKALNGTIEFDTLNTHGIAITLEIPFASAVDDKTV